MRWNTCLDPRPWRGGGFSLVEVVVVITMLGIISAFAIPRFTHLENDIRASEIVALSISLRSAAESAHAQYLKSGATLAAARLGGKPVRLKNGYPDASSAGIQRAVADLSDFTSSLTATSVTYSKRGAPAAARCRVTYNAAPASSTPATITGLDTSGC